MKKRALNEFGKFVNEKLIELNMTQKELAEEVGTTPVYLSYILRGERAGRKYKEKILRIIGSKN
jgi:Helix-turn-helix.